MTGMLDRFLNDLSDHNTYKQYEDEQDRKFDRLQLEREIKREKLETNCMEREDKVTFTLATYYITLMNMLIKRYHNSILTKKQKKSKQYSDQYWSKVSYMDATLSIKENRAIFNYYRKKKWPKNLDNDTIKGRYVGLIHFDRIERGLLRAI